MGRDLAEPEKHKSETLRKAKKRKRDEAVLDLPAGVLKHPSSLSADIVEKTEDKAEARQKKKKHDKSKGLSNGHLDKRATTKIVENQEELQSTIGAVEVLRTSSPRENKSKALSESTQLDPSLGRSKKRKKDKDPKQVEDRLLVDSQGEHQKSDRFIVFIGNLPFTATKTSIEKHFGSVKPDSIRHITHKDELSKSKGFAFLEFTSYDRMKTCLKLYHHSQFEDGLSGGRRINVELTAGGGGSKSKDRKSKLRVKNEKLNEERKRRQLEEDKLKTSSRSNADTKDGTEGLDENSGIHPSRRSRVPLR